MSRLLLGITFSLAIALSATILTIVLGAVLGIIGGYRGGFIDSVIGRFVDLTLSFPSTLMLLALSGIAVQLIQDKLGIGNRDIANGLYVVVVLALFGWPPIVRVVRGQVLSLREREFVEAAACWVRRSARIYFKEILPNLWAPLLVYFTLTMPAYISAEAALSFLGVGIKPPTPTLGNILTDSINYSVGDSVLLLRPCHRARDHRRHLQPARRRDPRRPRPQGRPLAPNTSAAQRCRWLPLIKRATRSRRTHGHQTKVARRHRGCGHRLGVADCLRGGRPSSTDDENPNSAGTAGAGEAGGTLYVKGGTRVPSYLDPQRVYTGVDISWTGRTVYRSLVQSPNTTDAAETAKVVPDLATDTGTSNEDATGMEVHAQGRREVGGRQGHHL